jgi:apocytochrome f
MVFIRCDLRTFFFGHMQAATVGVIVGFAAGVLAFLSSDVNSHIDTNLYVSTASKVRVAPAVAVPPTQAVTNSVELYGMVADKETEAAEQNKSAHKETAVSSLVAALIAIPMAVAGLYLGKKRTAEQQPLVCIEDMWTAGKQAVVASAVVGASASMVDVASAYPIFAQQGYANPREATGRLVCANCHLAAKPTEIELPQAVLPDQVFEAVTKIPFASAQSAGPQLDSSSVVGTVTFVGDQPVDFVQEAGIPVSQALIDMEVPTTPNTVFKATIKVPYDKSLKQVSASGKPADLNVGAVVILPEGFTLAPPDRIPEKLKEETKGLQFIQYSENTPNILVVGPVPGKLYEEMTVALLSPDPATNKNVHFGTVPVYVGANRGRGQLYPTGEKSNINAYNAVHAGKVSDIELDTKKRIYTVSITEPSGSVFQETLPPGAELIVKKGEVVEAGQAITTNPNVGGFGQAESEIVLQDPNRIKGFIFLSFTVLATQVMLVVKKKQYEQVQLSEMNF